MKLRTSISCKDCVRMGEKLCSKPAGKCGVERRRLRRKFDEKMVPRNLSQT